MDKTYEGADKEITDEAKIIQIFPMVILGKGHRIYGLGTDGWVYVWVKENLDWVIYGTEFHD